MARKPPPPAAPTSANLNVDQIRRGIDLLRRRIKDVEDFDVGAVQKRWSADVKTLQTSIEETIDKVFGHNTIEAKRYRPAASLDNGPVFVDGRGNHPSQVQGYLTEGKSRSILLLNQAIKGLTEDLEQFSGRPDAIFDHLDSDLEPEPVQKTDIFIVHGHDSPAKIEVARLIERAGLKAVILHEQPNQGRTIIEKFEAHGGAAGFAVILVTPDDVGGVDKDHLQPRARQNVIGEMFWFAGRLGRDRVCALMKGDIEMPSDFAGVGYTAMDDRGAWKQELLREMQAAGYKNLDWGSALA